MLLFHACIRRHLFLGQPPKCGEIRSREREGLRKLQELDGVCGIAVRARDSWQGIKQIPQSTRQNVLPVKRINRSLLMRHEYLTRSLVELMQVRKTSSGTDGVLHHPPEAFDGVEVMSAVGG